MTIPAASHYENREFVFTSESVSEGHPDKVADRISDAIVDAFLAEEPYARLAIETFVTTNRIVIGGEFRGPESVKKRIEDIAREAVRKIGYEQDGFHWANAIVENHLHGQSADIAKGVDAHGGASEGAGDQGIMFGYACTETKALMPAPIYYAHKILHDLFADIRSGKVTGIGPDAKSQLSVIYHGNKPIGVKNAVLSIQHRPEITLDEVKEKVAPYIQKALPEGWVVPEEELYINPTGVFIIGGPDGDTGLTGRKIIVDTYGGAAPHGGGAFSGKDPSKVDRSAAYMARYLAKNVVASGLADACTLQIAYAIGVAKPLALYINTHGTGKVTENEIERRLLNLVDLTPWGLRHHLDMHRPIYERTAAYGHFGREPEADGGFSWEKTDLAEALLHPVRQNIAVGA